MNPLWRRQILKHINKFWTNGKTGYVQCSQIFICDFNAILHRILSKGFCARVYFHFWNCINVLKNHQSIWFWQRVHGREPRIRCLCMREIHLQQGWQFNSRKMNGLFIKCIGKLIINLKKKSENTPHFISCTKKKPHNFLNVLKI